MSRSLVLALGNTHLAGGGVLTWQEVRRRVVSSVVGCLHRSAQTEAETMEGKLVKARGGSIRYMPIRTQSSLVVTCVHRLRVG